MTNVSVCVSQADVYECVILYSLQRLVQSWGAGVTHWVEQSNHMPKGFCRVHPVPFPACPCFLPSFLTTLVSCHEKRLKSP